MANAANASLPTVTVTVGAPLLGGATTTISFKLTNPASNQFAITGFTLIAPAGWTVTACTAGSLLTSATPSGNSCQYGSGSINPGSADASMQITVTAPTGTYPFTGAFTSTVQDGSSSAFYPGPTFSLQVIDPTSAITVTPAASSNFIAGSAALTETATLTPAQAGVPIVFSAPGYPGTSTFSFTPASVSTDATGKAVTTFKPSNLAGDATTVTATVGTSAVAGTSAGTITTVNGPPTGVALVFAAANQFMGTDYLFIPGITANNSPTSFGGALMINTELGASLTDAFGNAVNFNSFTGGTDTWTITLTATAPSGQFDAFSGSVNHPSSIKCTAGGSWSDTSGNALTPTVACPSGATNTFNLPYNYFQAEDYGTTGVITSGATGTYLGTAFISTLMTSGNIFTTVLAGTHFTTTAAPTSVKAGGTTQVLATISLPGGGLTKTQNKVPVVLYLDKALSYESAPGAQDYGATSVLPAVFSSGKTTISGTINSTGMFVSAFTVDTCANQPACPTGSSAQFYANYTYPVDTGVDPSGHNIVITGDTAAVITTAGSPSKLQFYVTYDTTGTIPVKNNGTAVLGATLFVDVYISDNFKNLAVNPGPGQIQIALAPPTLVLSASSIYIPANCVDTSGHFVAPGVLPLCAPFGVVTWTLPATAGALTLTASGVLGGSTQTASFSVNVVSKTPSITVQKPTPLSGVIYSNSNGVLFTGVANASAGYPATGVGAVTILSVTFSADGGASTAATLITSGHDVSWQGSVFFGTQGVHNITFTATDSLGNNITSQSFKVLIDTSAPTIAFTTATGSTLTFGSAAKAVIFDTEGDLNTTSVTATFNGTAVATANLVITGTNTLGSNSTFQVSINNLPAGTWVVKLTASDFAGNSNAAGASITVTVSVPFAQSVIINSANYTTIGSFPGMSVKVTNIWSTSQNLVVFAVWKNSASQTVAVTTGGLTLASGATGTAFAPLTNALPSGSYTVNVFVITTDNKPVSSTTTITVTV